MSSEIRIRGGIGPSETAAIMAAIHQLIEEELASRAMMTPRNIPTAWVRSGQRRVVRSPRHTTTELSIYGVTDGQMG